MTDDERGAFHEGAHAALAILLGQEVTRVELPEGAAQGRCVFTHTGKLHPLDHAIIDFAGLEAEHQADPEHREPGEDEHPDARFARTGDARYHRRVTPDESHAESLFAGSAVKATMLRLARSQARWRVREHQAAITRIAAALLEKRSLPGHEVRRLMGFA